MTLWRRRAGMLGVRRFWTLALRLGALALALILCHVPLPAQKRVSLAELGKRNNPDFVSAYAGQKVIVRGVVARRAFHFEGYALLAIQDAERGAVLKLSQPETFLDGLKPGDEVETQGTVGLQYGMPVVLP